ncbi:MAG: FmdB family zinc ribbon protein [Gemmatimonadota bacterium]
MPIYAYKCSSCGHAQDVLQKVSDAPLTVCTACGAATFSKQLTAAGFQLKGNGWYATDFKNGSGKKSDTSTDGKTETRTDGKTETKTDTKADTAPATENKPAPAAACGAGGCAACT